MSVLKKNKKYNFILITIDALRKDHMSCYGYHRNTTPCINKIAENSSIFTNAFSVAPYTKPSMISLFTSTYPFDYGGYCFINERRTIAEFLKLAGYLTIGIPNTPILSEKYGFNKGFNIFISPLHVNNRSHFNTIMQKIRNNDKIYSLLQKIVSMIPKKRIPNFLKKLSIHTPYQDAKILTNLAINLLRNNLDSNFFLWLHYMDTHYPYKLREDEYKQINVSSISSHVLNDINLLIKKYDCKNKNISKNILNLIMQVYDSEIKFIDNNICNLMIFLKNNKLLEKTIIIITSDHGEEFLDHGAIQHSGCNNKTHIYNELINVPLIVSIPYLENKIIKNNVSLLDIMPTFLSLGNIEKVVKLKGKSLMNYIYTDENILNDDRIIISEASSYNKYRNIKNYEYDPRIISMICQNWKYVYDDNNAHKLFNLKNDPYENINLISEKLELLEYLKMLLYKIRKYKPIIDMKIK